MNDNVANGLTVKVPGGETKRGVQARTVGELKQRYELTDYSASVNGESVGDSHELADGDLITFGANYKGGC